MNTIDALRTRRTTREYNDKEVSIDTIREIIEIALHAPSWKNSETTRYILVTDATKKAEIGEHGVMGSAHNKGIIDGAPMLIVVATKSMRSGYERDGSFTTTKGTHFESFDAGIATDELCLAAYEMGLATCIMGIFDEASVKKILDIDEDLKVSALVSIGYSDSVPPMPKRRSVDEVLTII